MCTLVIIPWAETAWSADERLGANVAVPLTEAGTSQARAWGQEAADRSPGIVYASHELSSQQTADGFASACHGRVKSLAGIDEVSVGLWEGLLADTVKARFSKAYKRWLEDPASVCPPQGEDVSAAAERIEDAIRRITRKSNGSVIGVVMGPMASALARCVLESASPSQMWSLQTDGPAWYTVCTVNNQLTGERTDLVAQGRTA